MVYQHIQSSYKMQFTRGVPLLLMNDRHWSAPCDMCEIPPHFHKQTTWTHVCVCQRYVTEQSTHRREEVVVKKPQVFLQTEEAVG